MLDLFRNVFAPPRDLILLVAASWIGTMLSEKHAARYHLDASALSNLIFTGFLAYFIGGRLFYVAEHVIAFVQSPVSIISLNLGLFDNWGGLVVGVLSASVFGQREKLPLLSTLDALAPFLACLAVGLALSHLASGAAFGDESNLPWAIDLWGAMRQPTQVYEIVASLLTLLLIWKRKPNSRPGGDFMIFVALTSLGRLVIEAFRGDSTLVLGGFRLAQILAWLALAASILCIEILQAKQAPTSPATFGNHLNEPKNTWNPKES